MVDWLKIPILRDNNAIHAKFRWGGEDTILYLLDHMNAFTIEHVLLWQKDTNTYADHDSESSKCIGALLIASSTDELNIQVNEKFDLLPILEKGGIVRLKLMLDNIIDVVPDKVIWTVNWLHYLNYEPIDRTSSTWH